MCDHHGTVEVRQQAVVMANTGPIDAKMRDIHTRLK